MSQTIEKGLKGSPDRALSFPFGVHCVIRSQISRVEKGNFFSLWSRVGENVYGFFFILENLNFLIVEMSVDMCWCMSCALPA